jgi:hypothetical protein
LQYEDLASTGARRVKEQGLVGDPKIHSPRVLWRPATIALGILENVTGRVGAQTRERLRKQLMDPQVAALVLEKATAPQKQALFQQGLIHDMARFFQKEGQQVLKGAAPAAMAD